MSNTNYEQFERLAKQYEMSTPRLMGAIIGFFKHLPISPVENELVYSMIRFFHETGVNPLEPGEDLSLVLMKRVLAELKEVSTRISYHNGYAINRQEFKLEAMELQTKAIRQAVENITYLIRLQNNAAPPAAPQLDTRQLVRDVVTAFSSSESVSVLVGDNPLDTLTSQSIELTRSHLQAAYTLYKQELPARRGLLSWLTGRNETQEREHIMELARQIHQNEAKRVLAGSVGRDVFGPPPYDNHNCQIDLDAQSGEASGIEEFTIEKESDYFTMDSPEIAGVGNHSAVHVSTVGLHELPELEEPQNAGVFPNLPEEDTAVDPLFSDEFFEEYPWKLAVRKSEAPNQQ